MVSVPQHRYNIIGTYTDYIMCLHAVYTVYGRRGRRIINKPLRTATLMTGA